MRPVLYIPVLVIASVCSYTNTYAGRPNIVLIIADDMNWDDCGAYGNPAIRTPNIDRLADSGMKFQHAYLTCSSCSPSRASIITGRYPHNTGAEQLHWPLPQGSQTFVANLKQAGYYTAAAGKWHLGDAIRSDFDDIYEASTSGFVLPSSADSKAPAKMIASQPSGCEDWGQALHACPTDRPFFLWLAALDPHREYQAGALVPPMGQPHDPDKVIVPPHLPDNPQVRKDLALYYDEVGRLDYYVGTVLTSLKQRNQLANTLILFISDNGRPFPRDKTTLYDGGIRTPLIAHWPEKIKSPSTNQALVSSIDIASTLLEIAEAEPLSEASSRSFANCLFENSSMHRRFAFAEDHWHDYEDHARAVVTPQFKLIRNDYPDLALTPPADAGRSLTWQSMLSLAEQGSLTKLQQSCFDEPRSRWELYDLQRDPSESQNLYHSPAYADVLEQLKDALRSWSDRTNDFLPSKRTPDEFDRVTGQPDHSVRIRPRPSKMEMFGTTGKY